ncbi:MAG: hypothetical protein AAFY64_07550, partial [Pseudomonadota bacterium]
ATAQSNEASLLSTLGLSNAFSNLPSVPRWSDAAKAASNAIGASPSPDASMSDGDKADTGEDADAPVGNTDRTDATGAQADVGEDAPETKVEAKTPKSKTSKKVKKAQAADDASAEQTKEADTSTKPKSGT